MSITTLLECIASSAPLRAGVRAPARIFSTWMLTVAALVFTASGTLGAVRTAPFNQWEGALHLIAEDVNLMTVVVPSIGGRVMYYGFSGDNILFDAPNTAGKTLATLKQGSFGGYQLDVGPELRGIPRHENLWAGPWEARKTGDYSVKVTSAKEETLGIQLEKEFTLDPDNGNLGLVQTMKNVSDSAVSFCLWDRTLCVNGGFAIIPLNRKSRFPAKWSMRVGEPGKWSYDGVTPASPRARVVDDMLVVEARGPATKVGADSDAGWIAYVKGTLLFVKYFPYEPAGRYTDGGNSVELYWDESVAELEPLSPEKSVPPGQSFSFPEKWTVLRLKEPVTSHKEARKAVKRIAALKF